MCSLVCSAYNVVCFNCECAPAFNNLNYSICIYFADIFYLQQDVSTVQNPDDIIEDEFLHYDIIDDNSVNQINSEYDVIENSVHNETNKKHANKRQQKNLKCILRQINQNLFAFTASQRSCFARWYDIYSDNCNYE